MTSNYGAVMLNRRVNSFIMECNSSHCSPIGDYADPSVLTSGETWAICNVENHTEHVTEGTERARKDRAKVNNQVMNLKGAALPYICRILPIPSRAEHNNLEKKKWLQLELNYSLRWSYEDHQINVIILYYCILSELNTDWKGTVEYIFYNSAFPAKLL